MKRFFLILAIIALTNSHLLADRDPIVINNGNGIGDRNGMLTPEVIPSVFYDNETHEIILYGAGYVSYYDVEISSASTGYVEISTVVNGTYDTIDVSSLPTGTHVITIESPTGNIYEGTFSTY